MEIRAANINDASAIATVHVASEQAVYRGILPDGVLDSLSIDKQEFAWRQRILSGASHTLVAVHDDRVCGWINFGRSRDSDAGPEVAEIRAMYVSPERWRSGIGSSLWQHARAVLLGEGLSEVMLWVFEENNLARQFYEKIGFRLEREVQKTLERGTKTVRAISYRLDLRASSRC